MAPAQVLGVLAVGVLGVMDEQRRFARKIEARDPLFVELGERGAQSRLVVGDVADRAAVGLYAVAQRWAAVGD